MSKRPLGVTLMGLILLFAGLMALIVGISIFIVGTPLDALWSLNNSLSPDFKFTFMGMIFGIFLLILSIIIFATAWGFIKGKIWAWWITIIIFVANMIGDCARLTMGSILEGILGILIALVFIFYLTRPSVREFFEKKPLKNE